MVLVIGVRPRLRPARFASLDVVLSVAVVSAGLGIGHCAIPLLIIEHVDAAQTSAVNADQRSRPGGRVGARLGGGHGRDGVGRGQVGGDEHPAEWTFHGACAIGAAPRGGRAGLFSRRTLARNSS